MEEIMGDSLRYFKNEKDIYKKYILGKELDPQDEYVVDTLCTIGFMKTGVRTIVDEKTETITLKRTARTCDIAISLNNLELYKLIQKIKKRLHLI